MKQDCHLLGMRQIGQCKHCYYLKSKHTVNSPYRVCEHAIAQDNLYMKELTTLSFGCWHWKQSK